MHWRYQTTWNVGSQNPRHSQWEEQAICQRAKSSCWSVICSMKAASIFSEILLLHADSILHLTKTQAQRESTLGLFQNYLLRGFLGVVQLIPRSYAEKPQVCRNLTIPKEAGHLANENSVKGSRWYQDKRCITNYWKPSICQIHL